jgi:hypothetical protein
MQGKTWGADLRKSPVMLNLQFKDATPIDVFVVPWAGGHDLTGVFCTSGSEKYKPEQIVTLLRQVEVELANGKTTPQACKEAEITAQTY